VGAVKGRAALVKYALSLLSSLKRRHKQDLSDQTGKDPVLEVVEITRCAAALIFSSLSISPRQPLDLRPSGNHPGFDPVAARK